MAFPWVFGPEGFELGTRGAFDAETDTSVILDFPHYTDLAGSGMTPFRGAYCLRVRKRVTGSMTAYVQENTSFDDLTANVTRYLRFYFYLSRDFSMTASTLFSLVQLESVLDTTIEAAAGIERVLGGGYHVWFGETNTSSITAPVEFGKWYSLELAIDLDNAGANDGTINCYLNDREIGSQITALDQGAIVNAKFGMLTVAGSSTSGVTGTILIDDIIYDDGRIYARQERWPNVEVVTGSEHVFVGPGAVESAQLLSAEADDQIRLYDTDAAEVNDAQGFVAELNANTDLLGPFHFKRGCYASLSGTNPRGQVVLSTEVNGPQCRDNSSIINHALRRKVKRYPS